VKAKIRPRIELENRTKLETVIPLSVPFVINVDPSDTCNFQCKFCPTGDRELMKKTPGRSHGIMNFELYKKIINDICEFEKPIKVLRLYKDGEPLLNPKFGDMVKYAQKNPNILRIDTTTNASLLNPERNLEIIEAGLDRINISVEGVTENQYREFSNYKIDFDKYVENIAHFYKHKGKCEVFIKINGDILSEVERNRFIDIFGDIADRINIEHVMSCWPEFELRDVDVNKDFGIYGQKIKEVQICPYVFYSFSINSDGSASLCFLDWSRKLIIGDAKIQSIRDIWNSKQMHEYQNMFLMKKRKEHYLCKECGQMTHGMPDNIDEFAEVLLSKIKTAGK
jgi:MoaA/NifB/PqqE/SkfB family radical SAM enzyme